MTENKRVRYWNGEAERAERAMMEAQYAPARAEETEPPARCRLLPSGSAERKTYPMCEGLLDYFPDALAAVSQVSWIGNQKHNPGEPIHWARGKSMDHVNCIVRHLVERGSYEEVKVGEATYRIPHVAALAWRALALCQKYLEEEYKLSLPRGAKEG